MKKVRLFLIFLILGTVLARVSPAETKSVQLPKGTKVEKTPEGCLKFTLPNGCAVKVKGFMKSAGQAVVTGECGILGDCGVFDDKGRYIAVGKQGKILSGPKESAGETLKFEGAVLRLPATVQFEPTRIFNRPALLGLSPQPETPVRNR